MADADLQLLGGMFRWQVCRPSGWDPRISARQLADKTGLARTTAWERLKSWRDSGFFQGCYVIPNPLLFDARMASYRIHLDDASAQGPLLEAVELMEGFAGGIDQLGLELVLNFVGTSVPGLSRKARLIERMDGVDRVQGPMLFPSWEDQPRVPDATDWALIEQLVRHPDASLGDMAAAIGTSERTAGRRYANLIGGRQVLFRPQLDYRRLAGTTAMIIAHFDASRPEKDLGNGLRKAVPEFIPFADPFETSEGEPIPMFVGLGRASNPAAFEPVTAKILAVDGIERVELLFPVRAWVHSQWFVERVSAEA